MLDYQRIVEDLRNALYASSEGNPQGLQSAAQSYAAACEEVNQRLRQCSNLLRQGLRGEAIQLCELEPNLLDMTAMLDYEWESQQQCWLSRETAEGLRAWQEGRDPELDAPTAAEDD